jgi:hypothetical protein
LGYFLEDQKEQAKLLEIEEIDGSVLSYLDDQTLKLIGMNIGSRIKLLNAIHDKK